MSYRRRVVALVALFVLVVVAAVGAMVGPVGATKPPDHKITICHATDSRTNPYVVETVDVASTNFAGHEGHLGPIFSAALPKHTKWGDIIPPTSNDGTRNVTPRNWPAGAPILKNGCKLLTTSSTTTSTTQPGTTTSTTPGETTTTQPGETTTTTTQPGETTTSTTPGETTTTQPGETTTTRPGETTTTVPVTATTTPSTSVTAPPTTGPTGGPAASPRHPSSLPFTGTSSGPLAALAAIVMAAGLTLTRMRRTNR